MTYGEKWGVSERKNLARLGELAHEWFSSRIWCWQHVDGREGEREKEVSVLTTTICTRPIFEQETVCMQTSQAISKYILHDSIFILNICFRTFFEYGNQG